MSFHTANHWWNCERHECDFNKPGWGTAGGWGSSGWGSITLELFGEKSRWWYKDGHRLYYAGLEDTAPKSLSDEVYEPTNPYMISLRILVGLLALGLWLYILARWYEVKQRNSSAPSGNAVRENLRDFADME